MQFDQLPHFIGNLAPEKRPHYNTNSGAFLCVPANSMLMTSVAIQIDQIYVPAHLRRTRDPAKVQQLAEEILNEGQKTPIQVRRDANRYASAKRILMNSQSGSHGRRGLLRGNCLDSAPQPLEHGVEDGREEDAEHRHAEHAAEHRGAECFAHLRTSARADQERDDSENEREAGHQNGPQPLRGR